MPVELSLIEKCPLFRGQKYVFSFKTIASVLYREVSYIENDLYQRFHCMLIVYTLTLVGSRV